MADHFIGHHPGMPCFRKEEQALGAAGLLRLMWPSYFADPEHAPPMPPMRISLPAQALFGEIVAALPGLEASLPWVAVPVGVLVGARSPMPPQEAGVGSAARIPGEPWAA